MPSLETCFYLFLNHITRKIKPQKFQIISIIYCMYCHRVVVYYTRQYMCPSGVNWQTVQIVFSSIIINSLSNRHMSKSNS